LRQGVDANGLSGPHRQHWRKVDRKPAPDHVVGG
jgi:hypothetical protein